MLSFRIKKYLFAPTLLPSIVTVSLLYLMMSLGFWQLDRAEYKANLQSIIESKQHSDAIAFESISNEKDEWLYQPVRIKGTFNQKHQIYFDNQVNNMVAGYSIFTPLKISASHAILVNRGWLALGSGRDQLPDISIKNNPDEITINGLLAPAPSKTLVLSSNANNYQQWPVVLQYIDISEIEQQLNFKLLPMVLIMNNPAQTDLQVLPLKINMRSEKHTAYAFQWFALSLALLTIYIVVNTRRLQIN